MAAEPELIPHTFEIARAADGSFRVLLFERTTLFYTRRYAAERDAVQLGRFYVECGFIPQVSSSKPVRN